MLAHARARASTKIRRPGRCQALMHNVRTSKNTCLTHNPPGASSLLNRRGKETAPRFVAPNCRTQKKNSGKMRVRIHSHRIDLRVAVVDVVVV